MSEKVTEPVVITADALEAEIRAGLAEGVEFVYEDVWLLSPFTVGKECRACLVGNLVFRRTRNRDAFGNLFGFNDDRMAAGLGISRITLDGLSDGYEDARADGNSPEDDRLFDDGSTDYDTAYTAAYEATVRVFGEAGQ